MMSSGIFSICSHAWIMACSIVSQIPHISITVPFEKFLRLCRTLEKPVQVSAHSETLYIPTLAR